MRRLRPSRASRHRRLQPETCLRTRPLCAPDRPFFHLEPGARQRLLDHPHFEVRAIAAKFADVFLLPPLLADPDETVRWNAARRLPHRYLAFLRNDPHREVRIRVAWLIDEADLSPMMSDADYYVRLLTARRIAPDMLPAMMADEEAEVRRVVASRIEGDALYRMAADDRCGGPPRRGAPLGTCGPARLSPRPRLARPLRGGEPCPRLGVLREMRDDPDDMVREFALMRLEQEEDAELGSNVVRLEPRSQPSTFWEALR